MTTVCKDELAKRVNRTAASILENEPLTADLDDPAAQVLLDWGVACAETIAQCTAGLDDTEAEDAMYPRLRAMRRLMRQVNRWTLDAEASAGLLAQMVEQAAIIYGDDFAPPSHERQDAFLRLQFEFADDPQQMIANLRELLEGPHATLAVDGEGEDDGDDQIAPSGENDDQKKRSILF